MIIQAKHTNGYNRRFSDSDFFSKDSVSSVLAKEIPRIKKLHQSKNLDHYMLFSNRRLAGNAESEIRRHISKSCGIPESSIYLCGVEGLELFLKMFPDAARLANLDPIEAPLIVSPDELAEVVEALSSGFKTAKTKLMPPPAERTTYEKKNQRNQMSPDYAEAQLKSFLKDVAQIENFLSDPENSGLKTIYETAAQEFQLKILAKRKQYQAFDEVLEYLANLLFKRDPILNKNKRLTRVMLFYMYWECDIGVTADA